MELYKVCVIMPPDNLLVTHCMARSAEVAYPRSQVSVYRTISLLVYLGDAINEKQQFDNEMASYFRIESNKEEGTS